MLRPLALGVEGAAAEGGAGAAAKPTGHPADPDATGGGDEAAAAASGGRDAAWRAVRLAAKIWQEAGCVRAK